MRQSGYLDNIMSTPRTLKRFFPVENMIRNWDHVNEALTLMAINPSKYLSSIRVLQTVTLLTGIISATIMVMAGGSDERTRRYNAAGT